MTAFPEAHGNDAASPWAAVVGPCYTAAALARVLGLTEDEIADAGDALRLLALRTSDGVTLYPAFQIQDGEVVAGLAEVLQVLRTGIDSGWTWAQWLNVAVPDNDSVSSRNIDKLRAGFLNVVLRDAERDAAAWRA